MSRRIVRRRGAIALPALLVLVLAAGGTATAAKLVTGTHVRNGSLTGADVRNGSVGAADLSTAARRSAAGRAGARGPVGPVGPVGPQGPPGTPGGYTKGEADARLLGAGAKAADAGMVDGVDGDDLAGGDAQVRWGAVTLAGGASETHLIDMGDLGYIDVGCEPGGAKTVVIASPPADSLTWSTSLLREGTAAEVIADSLIPGEGKALVQSEPADYHLTTQVLRGSAQGPGSASFTTLVLTATDDGATCRFHAQSIDSERDQ